MNPKKSSIVSRPGLSRRQFIYASALAAGGLALTGCAGTARPRKVSANDKLNIACIGAAGKGASDTDCCNSDNIVALRSEEHTSELQSRSDLVCRLLLE